MFTCLKFCYFKEESESRIAQQRDAFANCVIPEKNTTCRVARCHELLRSNCAASAIFLRCSQEVLCQRAAPSSMPVQWRIIVVDGYGMCHVLFLVFSRGVCTGANPAQNHAQPFLEMLFPNILP